MLGYVSQATGWVELAPAVAWDGGELILPQGWLLVPPAAAGGMAALLRAVRSTALARAAESSPVVQRFRQKQQQVRASLAIYRAA